MVYRAMQVVEIGIVQSTSSAARFKDLRFTPERLVPGGTVGFVALTAMKLRASRICTARDLCLCLWLWLLCSGDVETNPDPLKYPCTVCSKAVHCNQRGILCYGHMLRAVAVVTMSM